jgi:predicted  nucleic acid-binding Zn-ribbon protein
MPQDGINFEAVDAAGLEGLGLEDAEGAEAGANDPYANLEEINKRINKHLEADKFQRSLFEREWFRNVLFYVGQQWIVLDKGRWRPKVLPSWFPRAQTNKFAEKANDIISTLAQGRVPIRYAPATDDETAIATAEIGERFREVIYEEAKVDEAEGDLASWVALTGNAFLLIGYDDSKDSGVSKVPKEECVSCHAVYSAPEIEENGNACPDCGAQQFIESENEFDEFPIGAITADVISPFEIRIDHKVRDWKSHKRFVRVKRMPLDEAKEKWGRDFTPDNSSDSTSEYYLDVLANVTSSFGSASATLGGAQGDAPKNPKVTVYYFYELPTEEFPDGLYAIRVGSGEQNIVEAGELSFKFGAGLRQGQRFLPLVPFGFDKVPGRFWKKTRLDDLITLQIFRNTIEANLRLTAQRMGNSVWLNPKGSGVGIITGEPGQQIDYNPVTLGGASMAKPERVEAALNNVQPMTLLMNKIDDSMERVAGTFFLQGGETPPGVTAASALAYLGERADKSMSPLRREWAKGWKMFEELALEIARANWSEERVRVIAGKNSKWKIEKFSKNDLSGAVVLNIDYQSLFPKSQATERATIGQLIQLGIINPQDPEQQYRVLEKFGETSLKGSVDLDMQEAIKESDRFLTEDAPPKIVPMVQNSLVHLMQHSDFAKTDEFKELDQEKQDLWIAHIQAHVADIVARRAALMGAGLNPDDPSLGELSSGMAAVAAQATQEQMMLAGAQNGGVPNGAEGPDSRLSPDGAKLPKPQAGADAGPLPTPDIAGGLPQGIQAPREPSPAVPQG